MLEVFFKALPTALSQPKLGFLRSLQSQILSVIAQPNTNHSSTWNQLQSFRPSVKYCSGISAKSSWKPFFFPKNCPEICVCECVYVCVRACVRACAKSLRSLSSSFKSTTSLEIIKRYAEFLRPVRKDALYICKIWYQFIQMLLLKLLLTKSRRTNKGPTQSMTD